MSEAVKLVAYSSSSSDEQISAPPVAVVKPQIHPTQTETAQTGQPTDEAAESAQASEETTEDVELPRVDIDEPTPALMWFLSAVIVKQCLNTQTQL